MKPQREATRPIPRISRFINCKEEEMSGFNTANQAIIREQPYGNTYIT